MSGGVAKAARRVRKRGLFCGGVDDVLFDDEVVDDEILAFHGVFAHVVSQELLHRVAFE